MYIESNFRQIIVELLMMVKVIQFSSCLLKVLSQQPSGQ
jgi:hypothetical protein